MGRPGTGCTAVPGATAEEDKVLRAI
jgi:hypothetical protein